MAESQARRYAKFAIMLLVLVGLAGWVVIRRLEPSFEGKPLLLWAEQYRTNGYMSTRPGAVEARNAILQIGTNAIPGLLELVRYRESPFRKQLRKIVPKSWHERLGITDKSGEKRRTGAYALGALGELSAPAVPALIDIARNHPEEDGRYIAVFAIRTLGPGAKSAIPFLTQCLTNSSWTIRDDAALGLGYLQLRPDLAIPALIEHLDNAESSSDIRELRDTIDSLARWGSDATAATPKLLTFVDHHDADVRKAATNALWRIDPEGRPAPGNDPPAK